MPGRNESLFRQPIKPAKVETSPDRNYIKPLRLLNAWQWQSFMPKQTKQLYAKHIRTRATRRIELKV